MSRAYNFSPGPAALPAAVLAEAQAEFCEYADWRASVMEVSHRSAGFMALYEQAQALLRELLQIPDDYAVLFLTGGATGQAAALPLNLTAADKHDKGGGAAYLISGYWSQRAADEARRFCQVHIIGDSAAADYKTLPAVEELPASAAYLHYADNETVHGVEFPAPLVLPSLSSSPAPLPLAADMSSNIATRALNIGDYGVIYAGAQKNLGIAGVTVVIVKKSLLQRARKRGDIPRVWDYQQQWQADSMLNTPPTFQIYLLGRVLNWLKQQGGVAAMEKAHREKSALLYAALDAGDFYIPYVRDAASRSRINIPFFLAEEKLTAAFLAGAQAAGLLGLKGHKALGGIRASLYNSMPLAGARALVDYMREFERTRG